MNQLYLIKIYTPLHPTIIEYLFFSSSHGTVTKIDHTESNKTYLSIFKWIGIIQSMPSNHNEIKLETDNRKISGKC